MGRFRTVDTQPVGRTNSEVDGPTAILYLPKTTCYWWRSEVTNNKCTNKIQQDHSNKTYMVPYIIKNIALQTNMRAAAEYRLSQKKDMVERTPSMDDPVFPSPLDIESHAWTGWIIPNTRPFG